MLLNILLTTRLGITMQTSTQTFIPSLSFKKIITQVLSNSRNFFAKNDGLEYSDRICIVKFINIRPTLCALTCQYFANSCIKHFIFCQSCTPIKFTSVIILWLRYINRRRNLRFFSRWRCHIFRKLFIWLVRKFLMHIEINDYNL